MQDPGFRSPFGCPEALCQPIKHAGRHALHHTWGRLRLKSCSLPQPCAPCLGLASLWPAACGPIMGSSALANSPCILCFCCRWLQRHALRPPLPRHEKKHAPAHIPGCAHAPRLSSVPQPCSFCSHKRQKGGHSYLKEAPKATPIHSFCHPRENKEARKLEYYCKNCQHVELADTQSYCVYVSETTTYSSQDKTLVS